MSAAASPADAVEAAKLSLESYDHVEPQKYPWGWIRWLMNAQIDPQAEMTLGIVRVEPRQSNPLHIHPNSAEYLHVLSGACQHRVGDRWVALVKAGENAADSPRRGPWRGPTTNPCWPCCATIPARGRWSP